LDSVKLTVAMSAVVGYLLLCAHWAFTTSVFISGDGLPGLVWMGAGVVMLAWYTAHESWNELASAWRIRSMTRESKDRIDLLRGRIQFAGHGTLVYLKSDGRQRTPLFLTSYGSNGTVEHSHGVFRYGSAAAILEVGNIITVSDACYRERLIRDYNRVNI
ncbi:MAG: hypothetical protein KW793_02510, partial [Candidatus Doudnabacteria bacterium]|nr:hypothetical protein [Candidatus Doudnabacteria bacterium]